MTTTTNPPSLIITPITRPPRRMLSALRNLPSYLCPPSLLVPTILHSLIHPLLSLSAPLLLQSNFQSDRELSPSSFSLARFCSSSMALFLKLPIETVLRRGQVAVLAEPEYVAAVEGGEKRSSKDAAMQMIVPVGRFHGVLGTMYRIVKEEGSRSVVGEEKRKQGPRKGKPKVAETIYRRGQGLEGLWRGWKVSWWGLVGLWAAGVAGGGGNGEF